VTIKMLTTEEVATLARAPESTVRYWRYKGTGPRGVKRGRRVLYPEAEVLRWLSGEDDPEAA
jgi:predicted DNA-binding transcriptional regulator AlpA